MDADGGAGQVRGELGQGRPDLVSPGLAESILDRSTTVAVARFGRDGTLVQANARFRQITGAIEGQARLPDLVAEGQRAEMARLLAGGEPADERRNVHFAAGASVPVSLLVDWRWDGAELLLVGESPVADADASQRVLVKLNGRVSELARENAKKSAQLARALNDLQQAQTTLVHREKMAALGRMTAGVAHQLNNPLAYVTNNLYLLSHGVEALIGFVELIGRNLDAIEASEPALFETIMDAAEDIDVVALESRLPAILRSIDEGVDRSTRLVASLRTFSRLDEADTKTVDLNESMRAVVEFIGFAVSENDTDLSVDLGVLPPVTCSPGQLNQAVLNVLTNAIQSSSPGGRVGLSTRRDGDEVLIVVTDDGPGVPAEIVDRIFDPFFTTRPVGEGTGLGLSIAHTIVQDHRGRIEVERSPKGGASFTIRLPLSEGGGR